MARKERGAEVSAFEGLTDKEKEDVRRIAKLTMRDVVKLLDEVEESARTHAAANEEWQARYDALEAERDELRAALEKIVNHWDNLHPKDRQQASAALGWDPLAFTKSLEGEEDARD